MKVPSHPSNRVSLLGAARALLCLCIGWSTVAPAQTQAPHRPKAEPRYVIVQIQGIEDDDRRLPRNSPASPVLPRLVEEIRDEFGAQAAGSGRHIGFTPGLFPAMNWKPETLQARTVQALDLAEESGLPVFFHLDDMHFGYARPEFFRDPEVAEWSAFPGAGHQHGPIVKRYWLNWGRWMVFPQPPPCFESPRFRADVAQRLAKDIAAPIVERLKQWEADGKGHLFAGIAVGNETVVPDYRPAASAPDGEEPLGIDTSRRPPVEFRMRRDEMVRAGYHALHLRGYDAESLAKLARQQSKTAETVTGELLHDIAHDYAEYRAKTLRDAGIPRARIYTHFTSPFRPFMEKLDRNLPSSVGGAGMTYFMPPVKSAVNPHSRPGFTVSREMLDLVDLSAKLGGNAPWAVVESYATTGQPGEPQTREQYEQFLGGLFARAARVVKLYGWNEQARSPFKVGPGVKQAIRNWVEGKELPGTWQGRHPQDGPTASLEQKMSKLHEGIRKWQEQGRDPSPLGRAMQKFEPLMKQGKPGEAEAVLDQALKILSEGDEPPSRIEKPASVKPADIAEPFSLVGLLRDDEALNRAHDVELQGDIAYVPGKGGSLAIIDVGDPENPVLVSSMVDAVGLEDAETVLPMGNGVLLLGTRDFLSIDVSDPARPKILKKISAERIDRINGMVLRGDHVLAANKSGYVDVFDVSDPRDPVFVDAIDAKANGGLRSPHDIGLVGRDHAIVVNAGDVDSFAEKGEVFLRIYRVADEATHELLPCSKWTFEGVVRNEGKLANNLSGANRVAVADPAVAGPYACVGAFVCGRVGIIDVANPERPRQVANMPVGDIHATGMAVYGKVLFVAGGECVEAIDISDPKLPVSIAQYRGGDLFPTRRLIFREKHHRYDNGHDLVYRDGYLYVTAQNDHSLGILKVNDERVRELAVEGQEKLAAEGQKK